MCVQVTIEGGGVGSHETKITRSCTGTIPPAPRHGPCKWGVCVCVGIVIKSLMKFFVIFLFGLAVILQSQHLLKVIGQT